MMCQVASFQVIMARKRNKRHTDQEGRINTRDMIVYRENLKNHCFQLEPKDWVPLCAEKQACVQISHIYTLVNTITWVTVNL